jgi:opacity protein-like surface antigen
MLPAKWLSIPFCIAATFCLPISAEASKPAITNPIESKVSGRTKISKTAAHGSQDSGQSPRWKLVQSTVLAPQQIWELAPSDQASSSLNWQAGTTSQQPTATPAPKVDTDTSNTQPSNQLPSNPWIIGLGGGLRVGINDPNYGMAYGRIGRMIGEDTSISLRPAYVFGNIDSAGAKNNEGAFQMPLTLDLYPNSLFSPYVGGGIATNTGSSGSTDAMATAGLDINISKQLSLGLGINYIFESPDEDNRDVEGFAVLYFKF